GGDHAQVLEMIEPHVAKTAMAIMHGLTSLPPRLRRPDAENVRRQLAALKDAGIAATREVKKDRSSVLLAVPKEVCRAALLAAQLEDKGTNEEDLRGVAVHEIDRIVHRFANAVLVWEKDQHVLVSARSMEEGPARELAKHIGSLVPGG